jgi:hypothetical protein
LGNLIKKSRLIEKQKVRARVAWFRTN